MHFQTWTCLFRDVKIPSVRGRLQSLRKGLNFSLWGSSVGCCSSPLYEGWYSSLDAEEPVVLCCPLVETFGTACICDHLIFEGILKDPRQLLLFLSYDVFPVCIFFPSPNGFFTWHLRVFPGCEIVTPMVVWSFSCFIGNSSPTFLSSRSGQNAEDRGKAIPCSGKQVIM